MPKVKKNERYVSVAYELLCGCERATALAYDLNENERLKADKGFYHAKDDTRRWDIKNSVVVVTYYTLNDAFRLDPIVRGELSRKVNFN